MNAWLEPMLVRTLRLEPRFPQLFVVGAPRSGTTIVYQCLVNAFRFAYFPNAAKEHPRTPVSATERALAAYGVPETWDNSYGEVEGPMAPGDGWKVFRRWFPTYDEEREVDAGRLHELRTIVRLFEKLFGAPFVSKNNHNATRVAALAALFPESLWLHVRRDPVDTAASLLEARRRHGVEVGKWWSASPPRFHGRAFASELEQVVCTIWGLDAGIEEDLGALPRERWRAVDYGEFCADPAASLDQVRNAFAARGTDLAARETPPPRLRKRRAPPEAREALEDEVLARIRALEAGRA